ncbi:MAG: FAD-dependent oxidoreductase [Thermomicrobiales bacterium]
MSRSRVAAFEVAIVGGGVGGATLAAVLAEAGLDVVVVEREPVFRDKVRGEGIHPWGYREAKRLGLDPALAAAGAVELPIWQNYTDRQADEPSYWADDPENGLPEVTVVHPALQEALLEHAATHGATVIRPAKVTALTLDGTPKITVASEDGERTIRARLVVGADGRTSRVRSWIGARTEEDPVHHHFAGGLIGGTTLPEGKTHAATFDGGRMFIFPQSHGQARAYVVGMADRLAALRGAKHRTAFVDYCARLLPDGWFERATPAGPVAFFPNNDVWSNRLTAAGVVLIGDAAGANDPSVGQGLSLVFRDVRELRDLLLGERDWPAAIEEFARRRATYFAVLRAFAMWVGVLAIESGSVADARRARVERARKSDPTAGGFAMIFSRGPDGLIVDDDARRRFFGDDCP